MRAMSNVNDPQDIGAVSLRLFRSYSRWTSLYLLAVLVLWILGFEAIYESATPFYAVPKAATDRSLTLLIAVLTFAATAALAWTGGRPCAPRGAACWSLASASLSFIMLGGLICLTGYVPTPGAGSFLADLLRQGIPFSVAVLGLAGLTYGLRRGYWTSDEAPSSRVVAWSMVGLIFFAVAFASSIAMLRDGLNGISQAYARYDHEYVGDIGFGGSLRGLFQHYVDRHEYLSMHAKVHPPGPVALLWLMSYFTLSREAMPMSLATIVVGSLGVVPLYLWVRDMLDHRVAFLAAVLYVMMPSVVLFTATSADILFMPFSLLTLFLFWRAIHRNSTACALAAGVMYGVISLLSFSLLGLGAFFGIVGLWRLLEPPRRAAVVRTAVLMAAAFLALHAAVWLWSGFDMVAAFKLAKAQFDLDQVNLDLQAPRWPSWVWKVVNPLAWVFFAGIPVTILFVHRLRRPEVQTKGLFLVFVLTLVALDLLYLARGEGERSALYVFPFFVVPAAHMLHARCREAGTWTPVTVTVAFLAFQCWLIETLFYTYW